MTLGFAMTAAADQVPALDAPPDAVVMADTILTERVLPKIEHAIGPLRQGILDHLLDSVDAGPQSVSQILASLPGGTTRGNAEAAIHREYRAGRIERVSPGHYVLAPPPKPPAPPGPPPPAAVKMVAAMAAFAWPTDPAALRIMDGAAWSRVLDAYHETGTWDADIGPLPDADGSRAPFDLVKLARDRYRKKLERRAEAEEAAARQRQADAALRDQLLAAANGNYELGPGLTDMAPVRAILETVPIDNVLFAIRAKVDKRCYPGNPPLTSWRDPRFLKAVAEGFCRGLVRNMVAA
jgi:hypothetical protein